MKCILKIAEAVEYFVIDDIEDFPNAMPVIKSILSRRCQGLVLSGKDFSPVTMTNIVQLVQVILTLMTGKNILSLFSVLSQIREENCFQCIFRRTFTWWSTWVFPFTNRPFYRTSRFSKPNKKHFHNAFGWSLPKSACLIFSLQS